jgi:hypothetical protein
MEYEVQIHSPSDLSKDEIAHCLSAIKKGRAVDSALAAKQLPLAKIIATVRTGQSIVGVGVIKQPRPQYASKIAKCSEFPFDKNMLELGYVARDAAHRGHGLSERIVSKLLSAAPRVAIFATTSNEKMKKTLTAAGFVQRGKEWPGRDKNQLSLWVRGT